MFCPKCGTTIAEGNVCPKCGLDISTIDQSSIVGEKTTTETSSTQVEAENDKKTEYPVVRFVYFGIAIVVLIMFFIAANNISSGGKEIMQIQSVGGKTLEEAYYFELGSIYAGYAMISRAIGIFFSSVLVWIGLKN